MEKPNSCHHCGEEEQEKFRHLKTKDFSMMCCYTCGRRIWTNGELVASKRSIYSNNPEGPTEQEINAYKNK
jgi:hypothetical protein